MTQFSIIVPFHNSIETIEATLDSLNAQSVTNWQAICIDDRSIDGSAFIVSKYGAFDRRIQLVRNPGCGPSEARNFGVACAQGDILAFCDSDDLWTPDTLASLKQAFDNTDSAAVFGRIGFFTETPEDCRTYSTVPERPLSIDNLLSENAVCTMSNLAVRRDAFQAVGGFDRDAIHNEDLEFLIRLVGEGHVLQGIDHLQVWYRTSPTGLSSDLKAMSAGRERAIATAARYGIVPTASSEAIYFRYLARRALRLDSGPYEAWNYARAGLQLHARSFLNPLRRGLPTALASALATTLPTWARRALFCH